MATPTWNFLSRILQLGKPATKKLPVKQYDVLRTVCISAPDLSRSKPATTPESMIGLPERPKRPLTPFFRHLARVRPQIKAQNPGVEVTDVVKKAAAMWEAMKASEKEHLEKEYHQEWLEYNQKLQKYEGKLTQDDKDAIKRIKEVQLEKKEQRIIRQTMKEMGRPKRPAPAFLQYAASKATARGSIATREWISRLGANWRTMSDDEKAPFIAMHREAVAKYGKQMAAWEDKMLREGHTDLVRSHIKLDPELVGPSKSSLKSSKSKQG